MERANLANAKDIYSSTTHPKENILKKLKKLNEIHSKSPTYSDYYLKIRRAKNHHHIRQNHKIKKRKFIKIIGVIILLALITFFFLGGSLTGLVINDEEKTFTESLNKKFNQTNEFVWTPLNLGEIESIKISGEHENSEEIKIFIDDNLIYEYTKTNSFSPLTGQVTGGGEGQSRILNFLKKIFGGITGQVTENEESEDEEEAADEDVPEEEEEEEEVEEKLEEDPEKEEKGEMDSDTKESGSKQQENSSSDEESSPEKEIPSEEKTKEQSNSTTEEDEPIIPEVSPSESESSPVEKNITDKEKPIKKLNKTNDVINKNITEKVDINKKKVQELEINFTEVCIDTCQTNLNKSNYTIRIEISNSKLNLKEIIYELKPTTKIKENMTIILENQTITAENLTIQTIQSPARIGEPVIWTKIVRTNNTKILEIEIPELAKEILVEDEQNKKVTFSVIDEEPVSRGIFGALTGQVSKEVKNKNPKKVKIKSKKDEAEYKIAYETPGPTSKETILSSTIKKITIEDPNELGYTNITAFAILPTPSKKENILLYETINNSRKKAIISKFIEVDGLITKIEWIVPHLSTKTYELEIIMISKADLLDENYTFIKSIYNETKDLDDNYTDEIIENQIIRVTFEKRLTKTNDITLYLVEIKGTPEIVVYEKNKSIAIAKFTNLIEGKNKVILKNLNQSQDTFDLKIIDGSLKLDHIIDPKQIFTQSCGTDCNQCNMPGTIITDTCDASSNANCGGDGNAGYFHINDITAIGSFIPEEYINISVQFMTNYAGAVFVTGWQDGTKVDDFGCFQSTATSANQQIKTFANTCTECDARFGSNKTISASATPGNYHIRASFAYSTQCNTPPANDCKMGNYGENDGLNITLIEGNTQPTTPTDITCDDGTCDKIINTKTILKGLGSTDLDSDEITYHLEAFLESSSNFLIQSLTNLKTTGGISSDPTPKTCDSHWGWDCSIGPPETGGTGGDNTWDDCETGKGSDESVNEIYLNTTSVSAGDSVSVTCEFDPYTGSDSSYIMYYDGASWTKLYSNINWGSTALTNQTAIFTANSTLGTHWVRCGIEYTTTEATGPCFTGGSYYDNDDISFEVIAGGSSATEKNSTENTLQNLIGDKTSISKIEIIIEVNSYNPESSISETTNKPDLFLEIYNGTGWSVIGNLGLPLIYPGNSLDITKRNFTTEITNPTILTAWRTQNNQDIRIKAVSLDYSNGATIDEIIYKNIYIKINEKSWTGVGNHLSGSSITWNTTLIQEQTCINLRTRSIDLIGTNTNSSYFTKGSCLNISKGVVNQKPEVTLTSPVVNYILETATPISINFEATANDDLMLNECSLYHNQTGTWYKNQTKSYSGTSQSVSFTLNNLLNTIFIWNIQCIDNNSQLSTFETNRLISLTLPPNQFPQLNQNSPPNDYTKKTIGAVDINIDINASDDTGLFECSLYHNATGTWHKNQTKSVTGLSQDIFFTISKVFNTSFIWNTECIDINTQSTFGINKSITLTVQSAIVGGNDFKIQRGQSIFPSTQGTLTILSNVDYETPTGPAFVRLTNTRLSGMGKTSAGGNQNSDDFTTYISNPTNIATSINFIRSGTTNDNRITWEIIEYTGALGGRNEFKIRQSGFETFSASATTKDTEIVSGIINDNDIVVFITGQSNPDTGRTDVNTGLHTAEWVADSDMARFTRGEASGDATKVSYSIVEFTGTNWKIQRNEHLYTASGTAQTESINQVNDLTKTFLHVQHRVGTGLQGLDEQGSQVFLSSTSQLSYQLITGAGFAASADVAWIIENTQEIGTIMKVQHISKARLLNVGSEEDTWTDSIAKISSMNTASIMGECADSTGSGTAFPRGFNDIRLLNSTTVEHKRSDVGQTQNYRYSVVEWPTFPNTAPTINKVYQITDVSSGLNEGPLKTPVIVKFETTDEEGFANLNDSSAKILFSKTGEESRTSNCIRVTEESLGNIANYTCTVNLWFWDKAGDWNIEANINDLEENIAINNSELLSVGQTVGFVVSKASLTWAEITPGAINQEAIESIIISNTGNAQKGLEINTTNLYGALDNSRALYATDFNVGPNAGCTGTVMSHYVFTEIVGATVPVGNYTKNDGTGQEELFVCLFQSSNNLTSQDYTTTQDGDWILRIFAVLLTTTGARRKKKKEKLLGALDLILSEIKGNNLLDKDELLTLMKNDDEIVIPVEIFTKELGALESIAKYLKENENLTYAEIGRLLNRSQKTIWTSYHKAIGKSSTPINIATTTKTIPINNYENQTLTILETTVLHLRKENLKYSEIGRLLNRNERNIWTINNRMQKKLAQ